MYSGLKIPTHIKIWVGPRQDSRAPDPAPNSSWSIVNIYVLNLKVLVLMFCLGLRRDGRLLQFSSFPISYSVLSLGRSTVVLQPGGGALVPQGFSRFSSTVLQDSSAVFGGIRLKLSVSVFLV